MFKLSWQRLLRYLRWQRFISRAGGACVRVACCCLLTLEMVHPSKTFDLIFSFASSFFLCPGLALARDRDAGGNRVVVGPVVSYEYKRTWFAGVQWRERFIIRRIQYPRIPKPRQHHSGELSAYHPLLFVLLFLSLSAGACTDPHRG